MITNTFAQLFCENNAFMINSKKIFIIEVKNMTSELAGLLRNSRIHIEFHSKKIIGTKNGLKNETIKLNVKFFLVKP